MKLNERAQKVLEVNLQMFIQKQRFRDKDANKWISRYGCLLCNIVASIVLLGTASIFYRVDDYYKIFKENGILKDGLIQWNKLKDFYKGTYAFNVDLWGGTHREVEEIRADMFSQYSYISVDYKADPTYKNSHWLLVLFRGKKNLVVFDPWDGYVGYFPEKYIINNSIKNSIFSIINVKNTI